MSKYSISDIAKICGVSKATVSRVINNKPYGVGDETRRRIQKVIDDMNYRPNMLARSVATSKSGLIGLIIPDVSNLFYPTIIRGVIDYLEQYDSSIILCDSDYDPIKEQKLLLSMVDKRVDGVILCSGVSNEEFLADFKKYNIPMVSIGRNFDNYLSDATVTGDNVKGALFATRHLIESGNKKIIFLDGNAGVSGASQRLEGYESAFREAKMDFDSKKMYYGEFSIEYGKKIVNELLEDNVEFDAIMAGSDLIAIGAIKALRKAGIKVPQEVEVIGFDDIQVAEIFELSSVSKPHYDIAREATRMLMGIINDEIGEMRHITVEPKLVFRETTKPK